MSYATFVRSQPHKAEALENLVHYIGWLAPSGLVGRDLAVETGYCLSNALALLHDRLRHEDTAGASSEQNEPGVSDELLTVVVAVIASFEIVAEKLSPVRGVVSRRRVITTLEAVKAACRLVILLRKQRMLIRGEQYMPGYFEEAEAIGNATGSEFTVYTGRRTGRQFTVPTVRRGGAAQLMHAGAPSRRKSASAALLVGEVLHLMRPVVGAAMGGQPWDCWLTCLAMDACSRASSLRAGGASWKSLLLPRGRGPRPESTLTHQEQQELRRRKFLWWLYIMRSPVFELVVLPPAKEVTGDHCNHCISNLRSVAAHPTLATLSLLFTSLHFNNCHACLAH
ncbi:unnamed protein product [Chrysoparadoxa australica]